MFDIRIPYLCQNSKTIRVQFFTSLYRSLGERLITFYSSTADMLDWNSTLTRLNMDVQIDNFPVSDLPSRFNIRKQAMYNRMDALKIKPVKTGNRSHITADELDLLDRLSDHLQKGGKLANFGHTAASLDRDTGYDANSELSPIINTLGAVNTPTGQIDLFQSISKLLSASTLARSPIWHLEQLDRVVDAGWILTTAEVKDLIGTKPKLSKGTNNFTRGSFIFSKIGKIGNQVSWSVARVRI